MVDERRHRINPETLAFARSLRSGQTSAEAKLWSMLRAGRLAGIKFKRQQPIGEYIVDFYCGPKKLAIELDGESHGEQMGYDEARTRWLESRGCRVIRFLNEDVYKNLEGVLTAILLECGVRDV